MVTALQKVPWKLPHASRWEWQQLRLSVAYDVLVVAASFPIAVRMLGLGDAAIAQGAAPPMLRAVSLFVVLSTIVFNSFGVQAGFWRHMGAPELFTVIKAITCAVLMFAVTLPLVEVFIFSTKGSVASRSLLWAALCMQWFVLVSLLCGARLGWAAITAARLRQQAVVRYTDWEPVIIIGANETAARLIQLLNRREELRFEVVGMLDEHRNLVGRAIDGVPVLGTLADLSQAVAHLAVHGIVTRHVVLSKAPDRYGGEALKQLSRAASEINLSILGTGDFIRMAIAETADPPRIDAPHGCTVRPERRTAFAIKRAVDVFGAALLIVVSGPILLLIIAAVWGILGSPVIFRQRRLGRDVRPFKLYKIRTLKDGLSPDGQVLRDQQRRTRFGNLLRRTRLDELPQLWNVLVGDMSLIGPRPLLAHEIPDLGTRVHPRFFLRPGITGWAQVNGGRRLTTTQKFAFDLWYVRHYSLLFDLIVLYRTIFVVIRGNDINSNVVRPAHSPPFLFWLTRTGARRLMHRPVLQESGRGCGVDA